MEKIASFKIDHTKLEEGIYVSRIDGDITTYDLRTRRPNMGDYMDNLTMHSFEHMFATIIRNSCLSEDIIYFGPMGCQTGFYLLVRNADNEKVLKTVTETLEKIIKSTEMYGKSEKECGNYRNLDLNSAIIEAERYLKILNSRNNNFIY